MVARLFAVLAISPSQQINKFQHLQDTSYKVAIIKDPKSLGARVKPVQTHAGDFALVVATPKDGNCLPTALLRGLHGGQPLSEGQERAGMLVLRRLLADNIKEHNWPHDKVAHPQTLEECVADTETDGRWCGEVCIASFAALTGSVLHLWRYPNDNKDDSKIEPLMVSAFNEGPDRHPVHLLQTRAVRDGRPEFASHWESIIMKPIIVPPHTIQTGPSEILSDGTESFDWIVDPSRQPPLRLKPWDTVTVKGRGKKPSTNRIVCQLKRIKGAKSSLHVVVLGAGRGKDNVVMKPLPDIAYLAVNQASPEDILVAKAS
jgi:hypothetical protein